MIFTVTLNPAIDQTAVVPGFAAGRVNRIRTLRQDPGGKGINVSKCLQKLGSRSVAAVILAGTTGDLLEQMLPEVELLAVRTQGQTRTNLKIIDPVQNCNTDINAPGPEVSGECLETLRRSIAERLREEDLVILSGSLPRGAEPALYRQWTECFQGLGARVLLDGEGETLRQGIAGRPFLVKPNETELAGLVGKQSFSESELAEQARQLQRSGISRVVLSLGEKGAYFLLPEGEFRAEGLQVPVKSTVGAGDSMVAAMAWGLERKLPVQEQIRLAMAMSAASVMQDGSQPPDIELVKSLISRVKIL